MKVKAISLWQPWASLWACGVKPYETRSRKTNYRGPLLIHAAKADYRSLLKLVGAGHYSTLERAVYEAGLPRIHELPRGCIVGGGEMFSVAQVTRVRERQPSLGGFSFGAYIEARFNDEARLALHDTTAAEMALGDVSPGRWLWFIRHPDILVTPVPWRGRQSLFDVDVPEDEEWRTLRTLITELWGGEFE